MKSKELIKGNNEKRKQLTKENKKYYEDMLIYISLSFSKSEVETEEVLSELLDHLLQAQEDGKTAEEVFGENPRQYTNDIIGELPKILTKEKLQLFVMGILYFLASMVLFTVISKLVMYYIFNIGNVTGNYYIGTVFVKVLISIPIAFCLLLLVVHYLRWSCFNKINKILEFFISWIYGIFSVGIFMLVIYLTPDFGTAVSIPAYMLLLIGLILYAAARITRTRKWIT